jgi:hypothetical protein
LAYKLLVFISLSAISRCPSPPLFWFASHDDLLLRTHRFRFPIPAPFPDCLSFSSRPSYHRLFRRLYFRLWLFRSPVPSIPLWLFGWVLILITYLSFRFAISLLTVAGQ